MPDKTKTNSADKRVAYLKEQKAQRDKLYQKAAESIYGKKKDLAAIHSQHYDRLQRMKEDKKGAADK